MDDAAQRQHVARVSVYVTAGVVAALGMLVLLVMLTGRLIGSDPRRGRRPPLVWTLADRRRREAWRTKRAKPSTLPGPYNTIALTYTSFDNVPDKILTQLDTFAPRHQVTFFNDEDCANYLIDHCSDALVTRYFRCRKGAHRADLFRYAWLYHHGGIYLDVKTELKAPLEDVFRDPSHAYTVHSGMAKSTMYQGVVASPRGNPLFVRLLEDAVRTPQLLLDFNYLLFTKRFKQLMHTSSRPWHLLQEHCVLWACDEPDRYGLCCVIRDSDGSDGGDTPPVVMNTRFADFGKVW